jgi:translocation and assembly module TamB
LSSVYENEQISSEIDIRFDSNLSTSLAATLRPDSILTLTLPRIDIDILGEKWNGHLERMTYDTASDDIHIDKLNLKCTTSEDQRLILAGGVLSATNSEDFQLEMMGIHPKRILSYFGVDTQFDGRINVNFDLSGTADKPTFKGDLSFEEGYVGSIKYQEVYSWFDYRDDQFSVDFFLNFNGEDSLTLKGNLPLHFSLTDTLDIINSEKSIDLAIRSESIPIELFLYHLNVIPEVSGTLLCDFSLKNTLIDPTIRGHLQLKDGVLRSPYWGIDYHDIELNIVASDDMFLLEKFQIFSTEGNVNAAGQIQIDYKKTDDKIVYSSLNLQADNFFLVKHKDFEIQISSDIKYQMKQGKPRVSGYIDVNKSNFYLPTVIDRAGYVTESSNEIKPALVEARERKLRLLNPQKNLTVVKAQRDTLQVPGFLDLLEGNVEIRITRNTWIRNPQLRLELGGNIDLIMNNGEYLPKGSVNIVRGQYDLYGRRFTVLQGKVDFQGSRDINPPIFLEAEYIYRTVGREKRSLILKVSGDLEFPVITFFDSNNEISQDDALSIILYGRKKDELSFGTQSDMADMNGGSTVAMGMVSNLVSDRLARSFGDDLQLDVIEVNATDNWQKANFVVGKYITEDIFVTYKREFGQSQDNNLYPETISLEYEIQKNLYLQMIHGKPQDSGYDLLFKFDWE